MLKIFNKLFTKTTYKTMLFFIVFLSGVFSFNNTFAVTPVIQVKNPTNINVITKWKIYSAVITPNGMNTYYWLVNTPQECKVSINPTTSGFKAYTSWSNIVMNKQSYNKKYICFISEDPATNTKTVATSTQIKNIDTEKPKITITYEKNLWIEDWRQRMKAVITDNNWLWANIILTKHWLQTEEVCSLTKYNDKTYKNPFTSWSFISLEREALNWKRYCFGATDKAWNIVLVASDVISDIDMTWPVITITNIPETTTLWLPTNAAKASATDSSWPVKMWYLKTQEDIPCSWSLNNMLEYVDWTVIPPTKDMYNHKICFKAKDFRGNYSFKSTNFDMYIDSCGDWNLDTWEQCDDGNRVWNDGCTSKCNLEKPKCNFEIVEPLGDKNAPVTIKAKVKALNPDNSLSPWAKVDFINFDTVWTGWNKAPTNIVNTFEAQENFSMAWNHNFTAQVSNNLQESTSVKIANNVIRPITNCSINNVEILWNCGDWILNQYYEQCDDGNNDNNDGCNYACNLEVPKCKLIPSTQEWNSPLNVSFTFTTENTWWSKFTKFISGITNDPEIQNPTQWIQKTYIGENQAFQPKLEIVSTYSWNIANGVSLPKWQCWTSVGTMKHERIEHTLPVRLSMAGTCFWSYPVLLLTEVNKIYSKPHADDWPEADPDNVKKLWDESEPKTINWQPVNYPNLTTSIDRRYANTFQFKMQYAWCYQVNSINVIGETNNGNRYEANNIPNTTIDFSKIFTNADILKEDRLTNPIPSDVKLNIGFKHYRPDDISWEYTTLQEGINEYHPFDGDDWYLTLGVQDSHNLKKFIPEKKRAFLYPYCYVYPKIVLKQVQGRNKKYLTFTYLWCDVLETLNLGFETKIMWKDVAGNDDLFENLWNLMFKNQLNNIRYTSDELNGISQIGDVPDKPIESGIEDYFVADRSYKPCINVDYDWDGVFCNTIKDETAVWPFDVFHLRIDFFQRFMPKWIKTKFPTPYLTSITSDTDEAKDLYFSLYKEIQKEYPRISMSTTDDLPANDITATHSKKWYKGYWDIPFHPMVTIRDFKVTYNQNNEKDKLQNHWLLKIHYDLEQIIDETHNIYYLPYSIITFYDPYGNEIPLLKKKIDLVTENRLNVNYSKNIFQYIPIVLDTVFPDGIYTVKMEIYDAFHNKVERDQYSSFFKNTSWPQTSIILKELGKDLSSNITNFTKIVDIYNNWYFVDAVDFGKWYPLGIRVYLHNPISDLETIMRWTEEMLVVVVNGKDYYVPVRSIKKDIIADKEYFDIIGQSQEIDGMVKLNGDAQNVISFRDKYGSGNVTKNSFTIWLVRNKTKAEPYLKESYDDYTLKIQNIAWNYIEIPVVEQDNVFGVYSFNKDLWFFDKNGHLIVKNFNNEVISKIDLKSKYNNEVFKKIKILEDGSVLKYTGDTGSIKTIYLNNNRFSPADLTWFDYDNKRKIGFGVTRNGVIKVFKWELNGGMFTANGGEELIDIPNIPWNNLGFSQNDVSLSTIYIPSTNSYELFITVKGRLLWFNYSVDDWRIMKDYWPLWAGFANSLPFEWLKDIDVQLGDDKINIFTVNKYNSKVHLIQMPFIFFQNNNIEKPINLLASSTLPMSFYKKMIPPTWQVSPDIAYDDTDEKGWVLNVNVLSKKALLLRAYTRLGKMVSNEGALQSDDFIGFDKYELYQNGVKINEIALVKESEKKGNNVKLKTKWDSSSTSTFLLKGINNTYWSSEVFIPIVKYLYTINIGDTPQWNADWSVNTNKAPKVFNDGKYEVYLRFFDNLGNQIGAYEAQQVLIINNKLYWYIPLYMNIRDNTWRTLKMFDYLNGWRIELRFTAEGKGYVYSVPINNKIVSQYSLVTRQLIDNNWAPIVIEQLIDQPKIDSLKTYIKSIPSQFVYKNNYVEKTFTNDIENWDFESYDQLFVCISDADAEKLSYKMNDIYKVLYNQKAIIDVNEMDYKEYLNKKYEERKKAFKETKYQHKDWKNDCFLISELLK